MQSDFFRLLFARQLSVACAVILVSACQQPGQLTVLVDKSNSANGLQIILVPSDPATLLPADAPTVSTVQADSLRFLKTLDDSAQTLNDQFSKLRDELNAEAAALAGIDRRSNQYAQRYDQFRPRFDHAESIRSARDKIRAKVVALRSALNRLLPDSARVQRAARDARRSIEAVHSASGSTKVIAVAGATTVVPLSSGTWWVGIAQAGSLPRRFVKVDVAPGVRDTVRISM